MSDEYSGESGESRESTYTTPLGAEVTVTTTTKTEVEEDEKDDEDELVVLDEHRMEQIVDENSTNPCWYSPHYEDMIYRVENEVEDPYEAEYHCSCGEEFTEYDEAAQHLRENYQNE